MTKAHYVYSEFSPTEAARITSVSADLQRDWRRRGVLTMDVGRRATFDTAQIGQLMVRRALSNIGVALQDSKKAAFLGGALVAEYALRCHPDAVDNETDINLPDWIAQLPALPMRYLVIISPTLSLKTLRDHGITDLGISHALGDMLPALPTRDLIDMQANVEMGRSLGLGEAWSVVDLERLGEQLAQRAGRPVATIRKGNGPSPLDVSYHATEAGIDVSGAR